jgi:hypothetical protein
LEPFFPSDTLKTFFWGHPAHRKPSKLFFGAIRRVGYLQNFFLEPSDASETFKTFFWRHPARRKASKLFFGGKLMTKLPLKKSFGGNLMAGKWGKKSFVRIMQPKSPQKKVLEAS